MPVTKAQLAELRRADFAQTGNRVERARQLLAVTQVDIAEATGLDQAYVSKVCRGAIRKVTTESAHKFAAFFGVQIEDLFPVKQEVG